MLNPVEASIPLSTSMLDTPRPPSVPMQGLIMQSVISDIPCRNSLNETSTNEFKEGNIPHYCIIQREWAY